MQQLLCFLQNSRSNFQSAPEQKPYWELQRRAMWLTAIGDELGGAEMSARAAQRAAALDGRHHRRVGRATPTVGKHKHRHATVEAY